MKKSTNLLIDSLPLLMSYIKGEKTETEGQLNEVETTFLKLIRFYEDPENNQFDLKYLYRNLSDDWLLLALSSLNMYFLEDTYLLKNITHSFINGDDYFNQKEFVSYLNENGENYSEAKMSVYIKRNVIPAPDLMISSTRYWTKSTCEKFLNDLKEKGEGYLV